MAILPADQAELFLPLFEGLGETRQWEVFLDRLVSRTQARHAALLVTSAPPSPESESMIVSRSADRAAKGRGFDPRVLQELGLQPLETLRVGRVYALEELLDHDDRVRREGQRAAVAARGCGHARMMRVACEAGTHALLMLTREREDFSSAAAALLSAAAPYLRAALAAAAVLDRERMASSFAQEALARFGIGQVVLDGGARVIAADPLAEGHLAFLAVPGPRPARKLLLPAPAAERIERCCAAFAAAAPESPPDPVLVAVEGRPPLLLRPAPAPIAPAPGPRPVAIAALRLPVREDENRGAAVLRELYRLSPREAALAQKLSRGEMIVEAGRALRLTPETARNYSKRIYARTGTRGAADLVRAVLSGLAPLA